MPRGDDAESGYVPKVLAPILLDDPAWYGPATVTFPVQFPGDPTDPKRNDVWVRFLGERNEREERTATFDPDLGVWRATLYAQHGGQYRAILVRNGKDTLVEPTEGIVDLTFRKGLGIVKATDDRADRLILDVGGAWVGVGADLGSNATAEKVAALANAGANWVRLVPPDAPDPDFEAAMASVVARGLYYTLAVPASSSAAWRRDVLARYGASPYLVQWEAPGGIADPWKRATVSSATPWPGLFENRPGPFTVKEGDLARIKALNAVLGASDWADWTAPQTWKGEGAKAVGESDRLLLVAEPGAKLTGVPLADGAYDLTTADPMTGASTLGTTEVAHGTLTMPVPGERFFALRRRLGVG